MSRDVAADIYGVVLEGEGDDLSYDAARTEERRAEIRQERLDESTVPAEV